MKDKLEEFIDENRPSFDRIEPSESLWSSIEAEIGQKNKRPPWIWQTAAAVLLIVCLGLIYQLNFGDRSSAEGSELAMTMTEELQQVEVYYTQKISQRRASLETYSGKIDANNSELLEELSELDDLYAQLKQDLEKNQNDERLINAMIRNLQLRVEILNKQLEILERLKNYQEDEIII